MKGMAQYAKQRKRHFAFCLLFENKKKDTPHHHDAECLKLKKNTVTKGKAVAKVQQHANMHLL